MSINPSSAAPIVQSAIVTGGSGGIGRAIAIRLAADGFKIAVSYSGNIASAEEVVSAIVASGGEAIAVRADVSQPEDVKQLFAQTMKAFGSISAVVHSAGVMPLASISPENIDVFDSVIQTNLRGSFLVLAQAAAQLPAGGRIVALSTSVIAKSFPLYGLYIASKAGVEGLVHVLANELRGRGITVNAVAPGPVATELFLKGKTEQQITQLSKIAPLERMGEPEDIAQVVSFLVSADGGWVNGQIVRANGGFA